jgi:hypothetical protein
MNQRLVLTAGKDAGQNWLSVECHLCQFIGYFVKPSRNVTEFEAIKLVL